MRKKKRGPFQEKSELPPNSISSCKDSHPGRKGGKRVGTKKPEKKGATIIRPPPRKKKTVCRGGGRLIVSTEEGREKGMGTVGKKRKKKSRA